MASPSTPRPNDLEDQIRYVSNPLLFFFIFTLPARIPSLFPASFITNLTPFLISDSENSAVANMHVGDPERKLQR